MFALFSVFLFSQKVTIIGRVYNLLDNKILEFYSIYFNNKYYTTIDTSGKFILTVSKEMLKDSLKIRYPGFSELIIINLPKEINNINLGDVPMIQLNWLVPMVDFFCGKHDFLCRRRAKQYWKKFDKKQKENNLKTTKSIEAYRLRFNGKIYKLNCSEDYLKFCNQKDLRDFHIFLDLMKPEGK